MNKYFPFVCKASLLSLLVITGIAILPRVPFARAEALITVNDVNDIVSPGDTLCTLREAITNANTNSDTTGGDCAAGTGADIIVFLDQGGAPDVYEVMASLMVTDPVTILGNGQDRVSIEAHPGLTDPIFIVTAAPADPVRFEELTIRAANTSANGGGVYNNGSSLVFVSVTLRDNMASHGGGLFNDGGDVLFDRTTLVNNSAGSQGGGIANLAFGTVTLRNSTITHNIAASSGGGIFNEDGTLIVNGSTIDNNAADSGGGILNGGVVTITNSTISTNSAVSGSGGGLFSAGGLADATINSTTFTENQASVVGGGIYNEEGLTLSQSIVANNFPGDDCSGSMPPVSLGNNLDSDGTCNLTLVTDIPFGNADLGPLQNNGGPTETHALLPDSEALDAVAGGACPPPMTDQRGIARPQDGNNDGTIACDMGSFEVVISQLFLPLVIDE